MFGLDMNQNVHFANDSIVILPIPILGWFNLFCSSCLLLSIQTSDYLKTGRHHAKAMGRNTRTETELLSRNLSGATERSTAKTLCELSSSVTFAASATFAAGSTAGVKAPSTVQSCVSCSSAASCAMISCRRHSLRGLSCGTWRLQVAEHQLETRFIIFSDLDLSQLLVLLSSS